MIKKLFRDLLSFGPIEARLRQYYVENGGGDELLKAMINDSHWIFTQMKSGTTFFCNTLAFYNALRLGHSDPSFDDISSFGMVRNPHEYPKEIYGAVQFVRQTGKPWVVQTHQGVKASPEFLVLITRSVFDYCVSSYHFHYKNRAGKESAKVDRVLREILERYISCFRAQANAKAMATRSATIRYEDLMRDPVAIFTDLLPKLYSDSDVALVPEAIRLAGVDRLKAHEARTGQAVVAKVGTLKRAHFVRSGEVGEGQVFFSDAQRQLISDMLAIAGVPEDGVP